MRPRNWALPNIFGAGSSVERPWSIADLLVLGGVGALLGAGVWLAVNTPSVVRGPVINLAPTALPWYALLSVGRMAAAYALSMVFTLIYGSAAAHSRRAAAVLLPLIDVLQSIPILSFLPVVLLVLIAIFPERVGVELAAIMLIFTSQVWNLTFSFYQAQTTIPTELREAAAIFQLSPWLRFRRLELPFAAIPLIWNSMMSWAGGWFFLMAAEIFTLGPRDFRLPGLGAYLHTAADEDNLPALLMGLLALVTVIVLLDQLVWRPLLAWADKFKLETVGGAEPPASWAYEVLSRARLMATLGRTVWHPLVSRLDQRLARQPAREDEPEATRAVRRGLLPLLLAALALFAGYWAVRAGLLLAQMRGTEWVQIAAGTAATLGRVTLSLVIALAWTVPLGVAIGLNPRLAARLGPVVQVIASVPATALFPVILLAFLRLPAGLNLAAVLLMLLGTQWYLLFNVIAGAAAIPRDLRDMSAMLGLSRRQRWRTLLLPAIFPFLITGAITASGGAWNASIVAEYVTFGGQTRSVTGLGALIAAATAEANYPLLLAATLTMIATVVIINRLVWRRLYAVAETRFRIE
ncbi:MAG: ABC transporter permease subunit [Ardenticatenaceae bacterium]|nr:ABC transporter permease subunit [Ardenticatenaceae bacterium]HBY93531.1 ABC transporter permease [Chloroflexota bacterium]